MTFLVIAIIYIFIGSIYAQFNISCKSLNPTRSLNTHELKIEINQIELPSSIRIFDTKSNKLVYQINITMNNSNGTLVFHTPDCSEWNISTKYDVILDTRDLKLSDSTPQTSVSTELSNVTVNHSLSVHTTTETDTNVTEIHMISSSSHATELSESTTTTPEKFVTNKPPESRSAQLGMGLGITFIGLLLIGEIVYFKRFYHNSESTNTYPQTTAL
ncbi:unnamed protein product [Adineta steineri]|uniref:Uncharacterized protein n=1 Tax=Adineta steineri TaxID=433720 RepID=A0A818K221_9BILA|nr:unnamed protein product [Adineta steineri]CAF3544428.1 unnamed protein product [Adineta steineri]